MDPRGYRKTRLPRSTMLLYACRGCDRFREYPPGCGLRPRFHGIPGLLRAVERAQNQWRGRESDVLRACAQVGCSCFFARHRMVFVDFLYRGRQRAIALGAELNGAELSVVRRGN